MVCVHKEYCIYKPAYLLMVRDKLIKKIVGYRDKYQNRSWAVIRVRGTVPIAHLVFNQCSLYSVVLLFFCNFYYKETQHGSHLKNSNNECMFS